MTGPLRQTFSVGLIAPEFPPDIGGVETYSSELAQALARLGHKVTVFTIPHHGGEIELEGITVLPVLRQRRRLDRQLLRDHSMDAWHATNAAYAWLALEARNIVVSVHGNDFLRPYIELGRPDIDRFLHLWRLRGRVRKWLAAVDKRVGRWQTRRMLEESLPQVPCLVANSRYTEAVLLEMFPACRGRTSVAWVGVGNSFLQIARPARPGNEPIRLLTVCRLSEPRKNVDVVLRALAPLKGLYRFTYTVIGDGAMRDSLERLASQLDLVDVVRFAGRVSHAELLREMSSADLFILASSTLPASHEGFGIVYLEANAAGTPVLAARLAGAVEAVDESVSGMFVEEPTVPQVQAAVERFLAGEVTFDAKRCREFAARFTWQRVAEHFTRCYAKVASANY